MHEIENLASVRRTWCEIRILLVIKQVHDSVFGLSLSKTQQIQSHLNYHSINTSDHVLLIGLKHCEAFSIHFKVQPTLHTNNCYKCPLIEVTISQGHMKGSMIMT